MIGACRCVNVQKLKLQVRQWLLSPCPSPLTSSDAGIYTYQATVTSSLLSAPIFNLIVPMLLSLTQCVRSLHVPGVYLYLYVRIYNYVSNNSYIDIDEIGEGDDGALLCVNDPVQCCRMGVDTLGDTVLGRWIYPNGTDVPVMGAGFDFITTEGEVLCIY